MPLSLAPIPVGVAIVDKAGTITDFFRLRWQSLIDGFRITPTVASLTNPTPMPSAATPTTTAYTTTTSGRFRLSYYLRKTAPDGMSSSLTVTVSWVENGFAQTKTFAALTLDTLAAEQDGSIFVRADAETNLTIAIAYASNTPGAMHYLYDVTVEQLA